MHRNSGVFMTLLWHVFACAAFGCSDAAKSTPAATSSSPQAKSSPENAAKPEPNVIIYRALGNEPFWHVDVRANELQLFEMADLRARAPKYTVEERADGREYKSTELRLSIQYAPCSDGMSDRTYPHTARVEYGKGSFTGCGWPAGYDLGPPP